MKKADNQYSREEKQKGVHRQHIITYICLLTFGGCMLCSGFHTVLQAWQGSERPAISSNQTDFYNFW